jgi:HlyD family secretion protein
LSSPEQLDQLLRVTNRRGWLALAAIAALLAVAVAWGFLGTVSTKVSGFGIVVTRGGLSGVLASQSGAITELHVRLGDVVERGQVVASLFRSDAAADNHTAYVSSQRAGRVVEIMAAQGDYVQQGTRLLNLEPLDARLEALVYVPFDEGKKIRAAMEVEIALSTVRPEEFGYLLGRVRSASAFPVTEQGMVRVLGVPELARQFTQSGQPYEITVELMEDPESPSGYAWSSRGPDVRVESGTACTARIVVERRRPVSLVLPILKKTLGVY